MYQTKVKICGITSTDAAKKAVELGADALGFNFYPKSARYLADLELARELCLAVGPFVSTVGLFVNALPSEVELVLQRVPLGLLQFHGDESEEDCARYARPYIKALRMKPGVDVVEYASRFPSAQGLLLDTYTPGVPGGTGEVFDWDKVPQNMSKPVILAGGLKPNNVVAAIQTVSPWAVDVSGGVEQSPGVKCEKLMAQFISRAKSTPRSLDSGE